MTSRLKARNGLVILLRIDPRWRLRTVQEWDEVDHGFILRLCHVAGIRSVRGNAAKVLTRRLERLERPENEWRLLELLGAKQRKVAETYIHSRGYDLTAEGAAHAFIDLAHKGLRGKEESNG